MIRWRARPPSNVCLTTFTQLTKDEIELSDLYLSNVMPDKDDCPSLVTDNGTEDCKSMPLSTAKQSHEAKPHIAGFAEDLRTLPDNEDIDLAYVQTDNEPQEVDDRDELDIVGERMHDFVRGLPGGSKSKVFPSLERPGLCDPGN